ncbi:MAG TPA: DUF1707 domain-containing protein [Actinocrinis sp.]|nr:DUF1707 domain-containing protein [Actinocrinis sp.]
MSDGNLPARATQRVGYDEREAAAERLRIAAGDGRLTLDELEVRLDAALAARTYADLDEITADLPQQTGNGSAPAARPVRESLRLAVKHGHADRIGLWEVPARIELELQHSHSILDFRTAPVPAEGVTIHLSARHSSVRLLVPDDARIEHDEVRWMHSAINDRGARMVTTWDGPVIRLVGDMAHSAVRVRRPSTTPVHWWRRLFGRGRNLELPR